MPAMLLSLLLLLFPTLVHAKFDPTGVPNNKYGIHIADPNDIEEAAKLINSSGGDWGYITVVIQQNDRNRDKWQGIFNQMRRLHIIPIVRLATEPVGDSWAIPKKADINNWVSFLNSLNWPIENRYVTLFNEPNHAKEWGNTIDPEGYAEIFVQLGVELAHASEDFFIMPAGLDVSARSDGLSLDAERYLRRMITAQPSILDIIDGWVSHSYPNPAFSGAPLAQGRGTLRSFLWEKELLRNVGLKKNIPIFITETGWIHSEGVRKNSSLLTPEQIAQHIPVAASIWQDTSIVAVTPFIFNYQGSPFDHFSWKKYGSDEYYPFYHAYKNLTKISGAPIQREHVTTSKKIIPESLVSGSHELLTFDIENSGQSIINAQHNYQFVFTSNSGITMEPLDFAAIEPGEKRSITLYVEVPAEKGKYEYEFSLTHAKKSIFSEKGEIQVIEPPKANITTQLGFKRASNTGGVSVLIYDTHMLLQAFHDRTMIDGTVHIDGLRNIIPGQEYRIVLLVPYYLPRQTYAILQEDTTKISMLPMYPVDFNSDGAFTFRDILSIPTHSTRFLFSLLF